MKELLAIHITIKDNRVSLQLGVGMILRILAVIGLVLPLVAQARDELSETALLEQLKCEQLLADGLVFNHYRHEGDFSMDVSQGIGPRNFLGQYPGESLASTIVAMRNGLMWWDYSIGFAKSIEEARKDEVERKLTHVYKKAYLITDASVEGLTANTPRAWLKKSFTDVFANSRLVEFVDPYDDNGQLIKTYDKHGKQLENYQVVDVDKERFSQIVDFNDIYFAQDWRGDRFKFLGWTSLKYRGVAEYERIFKLNKNQRIDDRNVRRNVKRLVDFIEAGGTITINTNFEESLQRAVNMERDDGAGKKVKNSRYFEDPHAVSVARELYARGMALSVEARDKSGRLLAGQICYRIGNMISGDTVFFDDPYGGPDDQDLARATVLAGIMRFYRLGIPFLDANVVSSFTKNIGGVYVTGEKYAQMSEPLIRRRPVFLNLNQPFSLRELPYRLEDRAIWLDDLPPRPGPPARQNQFRVKPNPNAPEGAQQPEELPMAAALPSR